MSRLIDADELMEARKQAISVYENANVFTPTAIRECLKPLLDVIVDAPTINPDDLRPRGRWVPNGQCEHVPYRIRKTDHWTTYKCSECGYRNGRRFRDKFCPNCGARMEDRDG